MARRNSRDSIRLTYRLTYRIRGRSEDDDDVQRGARDQMSRPHRGCLNVRSYFVVQAFACRKLDRRPGFSSVSSGASVCGTLATSHPRRTGTCTITISDARRSAQLERGQSVDRRGKGVERSGSYEHCRLHVRSVRRQRNLAQVSKHSAAMLWKRPAARQEFLLNDGRPLRHAFELGIHLPLRAFLISRCCLTSHASLL